LDTTDRRVPVPVSLRARAAGRLTARLRGASGAGSLIISMFLGSFAWGFVFLSLPFFIGEISTADAPTTLRLTGWIVGVTSLLTVVTGPAWGRLAAAGDPKRTYVWIQLGQGVGFFGMAVARSLLELFAARIVLGFMGAASTLAFVIAGREEDPREVQRHVAAIQTAMTVGQILGPLGGAVAAARLGFRLSFVLGGVILLGSAAFVHWGVAVPAARSRPAVAARHPRLRDLAGPFAIILGSSTQLFFLLSVLPQILAGLGAAPGSLVELSGVVVFATAIATALGALATPRLAALLPERQLVTSLLVAATIGVTLLAWPRNAWTYTLVRFVQVLCVAPIFPLVVGRIAQQAGGAAIGIINSARIGASFIGPVLATSVLASGSPTTLYVLLAGLTLVCLPLALRRKPEPHPVAA
jgi:MFS transporter, DHA1 family, multidrug resistance protein